MQLNVYKASAGSGKTFRLSIEYIKLLMDDPTAFRHTLAVTFTNKATEEMKLRILGKLYALGWKLPEAGAYLDTIMKETAYGEDEIAERAKIALHNIIHDYGHFCVETIDAFFQKVLRNLARELKISNSLRLQVDDRQALSNAVDEMMDELNEKSQELRWIEELIEENIESEKSWNVVGTIKNFGKKILEDTFKENEEDISLATYGDENDPEGGKNAAKALAAFRQYLEREKQKAQEKMAYYADKFDQILESNGLTLEDLKGGRRGPGTYFSKLRDLTVNRDTTRNKTIEKALLDFREFLTKGHQVDSDPLFIHVRDEIHPLLLKAEGERENCLRKVITANVILSSLGKIRLLTSIRRKMKETNKTNDVFMLSDTQTMLSRLIDNSDTPFIFEKIGTSLKNIMIDEFQDTSRKQWENFKVLLEDCMANADAYNMIVGDVKQSIYRWRDGDWRILNNILKYFPEKEITTIALNKNFRSTKNIILFNNAFFSAASKLEVERLQQDDIDASSITAAYADVKQELTEKTEDTGYVKVELYDERTLSQEVIIERMVSDILLLQEKGARLSDMAIIVRKNSDISDIADYLSAKHPEIPLQTADALLLSASVAVNMIVDAITVLKDADNLVAKARLAKNYQETILGNEAVMDEFLIKGIDLLLPPQFLADDNKLLHLPLSELVEEIIAIFSLDDLEGQSAYVATFIDKVQEFIKEQTSDIDAFLNHWTDNLSKKSIQTDISNGITLLTIHKSKGLEFEHVFAPYCDWEIEQGDLVWAEMPDEIKQLHTPLTKLLSPIPVEYNFKQLNASSFATMAKEEHLQVFVDNLNLLYVLFTRARQSLFVYARNRGDNYRSSLLERVLSSPEDFILYSPSFIQNTDDAGNGENITFREFCYGNLKGSYTREKAAKENTEATLSSVNPFEMAPEQITFKMNTTKFRGTYIQSNDSQRFIASIGDNTEQEDTIEKPSYIDQGLLLHELFSRIKTTDDILPAVQAMETQGIMESNKRNSRKLAEFIHKRLSAPQVAPWFEEEWEVLNEISIIQRDTYTGQVIERRPDRVIRNKEKIIVIDYKFGKQKPAYITQVQEYIQLLKDMGYPHVRGYLWYVYQNIVEEVKP